MISLIVALAVLALPIWFWSLLARLDRPPPVSLQTQILLQELELHIEIRQLEREKERDGLLQH